MNMMHYYTKMHRCTKRLFLRFDYDKKAIEKLKQVAPCLWSKSEKAWHAEASREIFQKLKGAFPEMMPLHPGANRGFNKGNTHQKNISPEKQIVKAVCYQPGRYRVIAFYNPLLVDVLKSFPYAAYDKTNIWWSVAIVGLGLSFLVLSLNECILL
jgi:hypothetical protein